MQEFVFAMTEGVIGQLVAQCRGSDFPAGDGFLTVPATAASSLQVYTAGEGRAHGALGKYGLATLRALELEQFWMIADGAYE